jgi:hypothetical protein
MALFSQIPRFAPVVAAVNDSSECWPCHGVLAQEAWYVYAMKSGRWIAGLLTLFSVNCAPGVFAQSDASTEPITIVEVGAAPSRSITDSETTTSPTVAVEFTPIEDWLEIEIGTTPTFSHHSTAWVTDFLFKKPWTLSRKVEFMIGAGPEWIHARSGGITNSIGGEVALDFMLWPSANRRFGWYLEPAYEHDFGRAHENSIGVSGGLLITIQRHSQK